MLLFGIKANTRDTISGNKFLNLHKKQLHEDIPVTWRLKNLT